MTNLSDFKHTIKHFGADTSAFLTKDLIAILRFLKVFSTTGWYVRESIRLENAHGVFRESDRRRLMYDWANELLKLVYAQVEIKGEPLMDGAHIFVGNHISYVDIPLVCLACQPVFVAKQDIASWPVLGSAMKRVGTIFVKRESMESRKAVAQQISDAVRSDGKSILVFPSGTTTMDEDLPWKPRVFAIAAEHGITIQPFRIHYDQMRLLAYIDKDVLASHLFELIKRRGFKATIEFGKPMDISGDPREVAEGIRKWTQEVLPIEQRQPTS